MDDPLQNVDDVLENALQFGKQMMTVQSMNNLSMVELEKIRQFIPVGKDLVLSDLTDAKDKELFIKYSQQLCCLMMMQETSYVKNGEMVKGIIPAIKNYFQKFVYFVISTRASGLDRERMMQNSPQTQYTKFMMSQQKQNVVDKVFKS